MERKPSKYKIQKEEIPEFDLSPNVEKLQKQLDKDPSSKVFLPLAEEYRRSKMLDEAIFVLEEGLKYNPAYTAAKISLSRCYIEINEVLKAKKVVDEILDKMPHNPLALKLHGDISFREGDYIEARHSYEECRKVNPMDTEIENKLAELQVSGAGRRIEVAQIAETEGEPVIERTYTEPQPPQAAPITQIPPPVPSFQSAGHPQEGQIQQPPFQQGYPPSNEPQPQFIQPQQPFQQYAGQPYQGAQYDQQFVAQNQPSYQQPDASTGAGEDVQPVNIPGFPPAEAPAQVPLQQEGFEFPVQYRQQSEYPSVPLVSQEVQVPQRDATQFEQYTYEQTGVSPPDSFNADVPTPMQIDSATGGSPFEQQTVIPEDAGSFYTGPPTEPYAGQLDAVDQSKGVPAQTVFREADQQTDFSSQTPPQDNGYGFTQPPVQPEPFAAAPFPSKGYPDAAFQQVKVTDFGQVPQESKSEISGDAMQPGQVQGLKNQESTSQSASVPPIPADKPDVRAGFDDLGASSREATEIPTMQFEQPIISQDEVHPQPQVSSLPPEADQSIDLDKLGIEGIGDLNVEKTFSLDTSKIVNAGAIQEIPPGFIQIQPQVRTDISATAKAPTPSGAQQPAKGKSAEFKYNYDLAELYTKQEHFDKAIEIYRKLIDMDPDNADLLGRLIDTEKKKSESTGQSPAAISPTERIAKMEEWFRSIMKNKDKNR